MIFMFRRYLALFALLLSIYLLAYLNSPDSIDGDATLAVAVSWVQHGTPDIAQLGASESLLPPMSRMGSFGQDGLLYSKKGVTPSVLLVPLVWIAELTPLASRALSMLFNPLITALTATLLAFILKQLGFKGHIGVIVALLYGLCTLAFPYTKTLFGEPLAAFFLLTATYVLVICIQNQAKLWHFVLAGAVLGACVGINLTYVLMITLFALFLFGINPRAWQLNQWTAFLVPLLVIGFALLTYNAMRWGNPFTSGYNFAQGEGFTYSPLWGIFGLLLSPYRGVFWYSPILILAILGLFKFRSQFPILTRLILVVCGVQVLAYCAWWSWHGGIVWGGRFLIPVLPIFALALAPIVDSALHNRRYRLGFLALALVSLGIQLLGVLIDYQAYYSFLYSNYGTGQVEGLISGLKDEVMLNPALSPIVGHFNLLFSGTPLHPTLFANGINWVHLVSALALFMCSQVAIRSKWGGVLVLIGLPISLYVIVEQQNYALNALPSELSNLSADVIFVADSRIGNRLLDIEHSRAISTNAPTQRLEDVLTDRLWENAQQGENTLWFLTWFGQGDSQNWQERELWQSNSFVREQPILNYRALLFDEYTTPTTTPTQIVWQNNIQLESFGTEVQDNRVYVTVTWTTDQQLSRDDSWFIHLLDANGNIVQQQDRQAWGGFLPTSQWNNTEVTDYLAFYLPEGTDTQGWKVRVGWVNNGVNVKTTSDEDFILLNL
jgi:hypothetical protein